jgi:prepilin-type N-terminal cleavage/methylation domain-containing protein
MTLTRMASGFTLAELLIAVSIMGMIATFNITKVVYAVQTQQQKTVFKDTLGTMNAILMNGTLENPRYTGAMFLSDLSNKLNTVKICNSDAVSNGCITAGQDGGSVLPWSGYGAIKLHNGATLLGFQTSNVYGMDYILFDINGEAPPNANGEDTIELVFCYQDDFPGCQNWTNGGAVDDEFTGQRGQGTIAPGWPAARYYEILGNG